MITNPKRNDGFGAQYQTIIYSVIYAELNNYKFLYTPFEKMEHNYDDDNNFIKKKEDLINFIGNFEINKDKNFIEKDVFKFINFFESNLNKCVSSESLKKIKKIFKENKINPFDKNYFNIAIHVRRPNSHDNRLQGADVPDCLFLEIIEKLRIKYKNALFHIYSQGNYENFLIFENNDTILHIDEELEDTFTDMVFSDLLVLSPSSLSYVAGILNDGIVYYIPFWHPPLPGWNIL